MKSLWLSMFASLVLVAAPTHAQSAPTKRLGKFGPWTALLDGGKNGRICYVYAEPASKKGRYSKRGDVFVEVIHAPAEDRRNEVLFIAGYTYKKGGNVRVDIDGRKFVLFTDKDTAWTSGPTKDRDLVRAMRQGLRMVVRGRSWRGTLTTDTYSLKGFTAAHRAISAACNVR